MVGVVAAVAAVVLMLLYVASVRAEESTSRKEALARYGGEQTEVCVASRDILPGETINATNTATGTWLSTLLPQGVFTSLEDAQGKEVSTTILANEPVCEARLDMGEGVDVPDGLCAVSVPTQDVRAVGGALQPGSRIDVYVQGNSGVSLLGQGLLVLDTSAQGSSKASSLSWVTLAVTSESVQQLLNASATQELFLVLPGGSAGNAGEVG